MNKGLRHERKMNRYKRRLKNLGRKEGEGKFYAYRSHGTPCSCGMCSYLKYNRAEAKRGLYKEKVEGLAEFNGRYNEDFEEDFFDDLMYEYNLIEILGFTIITDEEIDRDRNTAYTLLLP